MRLSLTKAAQVAVSRAAQQEIRSVAEWRDLCGFFNQQRIQMGTLLEAQNRIVIPTEAEGPAVTSIGNQT
jgi:hypothetical protein